ncbi:hypothetical protein VNO80_14223 [Phaseolus coccineus]|uniref:Uncharacterized protein n=1 Tax=Phaseolus coccineus TaxID=3886 RepID=A0AAN9R5S8_PHACN
MPHSNLELSRRIWNREPTAVFTTMSLRHEELFKDYGHVDRLFAINNQANLERHWILADAAGIIHHVEYNEDLLHPRLTRGWMELRNFYGLLGEHHILIGYVGAASFQLTVFRSDAGQVAMNGFLCDIASTEALFQGHFAHYRLTLNAEIYNNDYLIVSGEGFGNYIEDSDFGHFILCGPLIHEIFVVETSPTSSSTFYLGPLWNEFCRSNEFDEGDTIIFEVQTDVRNSHIKVLLCH